jgi:hypothetical protein
MLCPMITTGSRVRPAPARPSRRCRSVVVDVAEHLAEIDGVAGIARFGQMAGKRSQNARLHP